MKERVGEKKKEVDEKKEKKEKEGGGGEGKGDKALSHTQRAHTRARVRGKKFFDGKVLAFGLDEILPSTSYFLEELLPALKGQHKLA